MFAYLHYRMLVHNKNPNAEADAFIVLKNAALESSLMSIRDLDLFFVSKRQWADDIIASDYGFVPKHRPLDDMERDSITPTNSPKRPTSPALQSRRRHEVAT